MGKDWVVAFLSVLFFWVLLVGPALADGPYCPDDRGGDCPRTGLADGCCWDMHFDFERGSNPDLALGEQADLNARFEPFGVRFGETLLPDLRTGRFGRASGDLPRVARGVPSGQLLTQDQCKSFAISFQPGLKVFRVQFTLKGMSGRGPVTVRTDVQYRDTYSRTYWERIENPGTLPTPPGPNINEPITVGLSDAAAAASGGNALLGLRITFDPDTCSSVLQPQPEEPPYPNRFLEPPPPIRIDDLYVWTLNPPEVARNSVRALAVEANQSVMSRPTRIEDPAVPVLPDTRLMIDADNLRVLPFIASKDTLVRFYLGARYRPREFKPKFHIAVFNRDGSTVEYRAEWQEAGPILGTVRALTQVPHVPSAASEDVIDQEIFRLRAGVARQGTADLFIPPRMTRDAAFARVGLYDADDPDGDAIGEVSLRFERPVTLGLNMVLVSRENPPDGYFDEEYEVAEGLLRTHLRWVLPVSEPIKLNRLPGVVDLRPHPASCAAFLADRAALFLGTPTIAGTDWTSHLVVEVVPGGIADHDPCEFVGATQGPGGIPLVVTNISHSIRVAQGIARNIGLVEICSDRIFSTPECETSWPYIEGSVGHPEETFPSRKWGNLGLRIVRDLSFSWDDRPRGSITVNPTHTEIFNTCIVTQSIVSRFPYCTEAQGTGFDADDFYVHDLMAWGSPHWISDVTYYRLYECIAYGRCFDPPLYSLPDHELMELAGEIAEGLENKSSFGWQETIRKALERSALLEALQDKKTKDDPSKISTTFSNSDFANHPGSGAAGGERVKALVVSGALAADGTVHGIKVLARSLPRKQLEISSEGTYGVELYTDKGLAGVIGFEPYAVSGSRKPSRGFNVVAPYTDKLAKLVVRKNEKILFAKTDRPAKLYVALEKRTGFGRGDEGSLTIRWKVVGKLSSAAEQVIEFSPDGGKIWHPIAALVGDSREFAIKLGNFPAGKRGRFAVSVSDGIASSRAESPAAH